MQAPPAVDFSRVSRTYRRADGSEIRAVDDVALKIAEGEFACLVGPSGCGKSTMLQMCAGLVAPSAGVVRARGQNITRPGPDRGVVFQKDSVFPWMSVIRNVEYGLRCRGVPAAERRDVARHYLARVGLTSVENAWPRELSGGMLKRVAIAAVFANGSPILLLDEPFGALDYVTRHKIHDVLLDLWAETSDSGGRRTVLFVTHDVDEALTLGDRLVVMGRGRIVDDVPITVPRPRTLASLLEPQIVAARSRLLRHLGIETGTATPVESALEPAR